MRHELLHIASEQGCDRVAYTGRAPPAHAGISVAPGDGHRPSPECDLPQDRSSYRRRHARPCGRGQSPPTTPTSRPSTAAGGVRATTSDDEDDDDDDHRRGYGRPFDPHLTLDESGRACVVVVAPGPVAAAAAAACKRPLRSSGVSVPRLQWEATGSPSVADELRTCTTALTEVPVGVVVVGRPSSRGAGSCSPSSYSVSTVCEGADVGPDRRTGRHASDDASYDRRSVRSVRTDSANARVPGRLQHSTLGACLTLALLGLTSVVLLTVLLAYNTQFEQNIIHRDLTSTVVVAAQPLGTEGRELIGISMWQVVANPSLVREWWWSPVWPYGLFDAISIARGMKAVFTKGLAKHQARTDVNYTGGVGDVAEGAPDAHRGSSTPADHSSRVPTLPESSEEFEHRLREMVTRFWTPRDDNDFVGGSGFGFDPPRARATRRGWPANGGRDVDDAVSNPSPALPTEPLSPPFARESPRRRTEWFLVQARRSHGRFPDATWDSDANGGNASREDVAEIEQLGPERRGA
ncbi:hypothetical protein HPB51_013495 [Rhipicephalus microplus]|uniref:Uncharacterized protein n=1 Tax=Rhipicephalus microplus TaxID=6941 RepID=A0A9J6ENH9_RHIMP|nr:hypothetical protein HPB51_013495 [Rhipicephalus microplus]